MLAIAAVVIVVIVYIIIKRIFILVFFIHGAICFSPHFLINTADTISIGHNKQTIVYFISGSQSFRDGFDLH